MSTQLVACPHCGTNLQNTPAIAAQVVACPQCQGQLQMPALDDAQVSLGLPEPAPSLPEPVPELPQSVPSPSGSGVNLTTAPRVSDDTPSALDRIHRRKSPVPIILGTMLVLILIIAGTLGFMVQHADKQRKEATKQLVGNWELIAGASDVRSLAFHSEGRKLQVLLEAEPPTILDGQWRVSRVRGSRADVVIDWLDGTGETWVAHMSGGQLHVELPSVGILTFRAAVPGVD